MEKSNNSSQSNESSPMRTYRDNLVAEMFDDMNEGIYERCIDSSDDSIHADEKILSGIGKISNSVCIKLLRGDDNYNLMLENIINKIINIFSSDIGSISVPSREYYGDDQQNIICLALAERTAGILFPAPEDDGTLIKSMRGIFGHSIASGKIIVSNDVVRDPRLKKIIPNNHPYIYRLIIIPLKYQNNVIGLLSIANSKEKYTLDIVNKILYFTEICTNLTIKSLDSRKTLASRIQKINQVDAAKDKFLATMSHELRTPLNGIMGMVTLFPDSGPLNTKQREYLKNLTECTVKLTGLLNNFLDFSKMSSDRLSLKKQPFMIKDAAEDSIKMVEGNASSKNIEIVVDIDEKIPALIGDRQRIVQILSNLLSNAVKFTDKGNVKLNIKGTMLSEKIVERASKWKLSFSVKDTGLGIPLNEQDKIFDVFYQSSNLSSYLSQSGTGLGLSITRELIRLMGGKISVSSDGIPGNGTRFDFYIILDEEIDITSIKKEHASKIIGSHILVVDDRAEMRIQISDILFKWKCIPQAVSSAAEALQYLQYGMEFKVALIDINMPQMSGVELAQEIREKFPSLPLIGLSSIELSGGEDYFDFYMYKPIDQNTLFPALLQCIIKPRQISKKSSSCRRKKSKKELKILVAEDDPYNRFTIKELLLNIGYRESCITLVNDGVECIERVRREMFDVVLMDIIMPGMDGLEASQQIKRTQNPPMIIAVSAAVQPSDKSKCQSVGIDGYLSKPIIKEKLVSALSPLTKNSGRPKKRKSSKTLKKYHTVNESKLKRNIGENKDE